MSGHDGPRHHGFPDRTLGAGATLFMRAAKGHDIESIRVLLEARASANAQQQDGSSVLHVMATARPTRNDEEAATAATCWAYCFRPAQRSKL
jgi:hypothetical protein